MNVENNYNPNLNPNTNNSSQKPKIRFEDTVFNAFKLIRQNMPSEGDFEDIRIDFNTDNDKYSIYATTYFDSKDKKFHNSLKLDYTNDNSNNIATYTLKRGSKQDILDFLGNENNIRKIESYMAQLKKESQRVN